MHDMAMNSREEQHMINDVMSILLADPQDGLKPEPIASKRSFDDMYKHDLRISSLNLKAREPSPSFYGCKRELMKRGAWTLSQEEIIRSANPLPVSSNSQTIDKFPNAQSQAETKESLPCKRDQMKRSSWTRSQDDLLVLAVSLHGAKNWKEIAKCLPGRNHVQCLQRWQKVLMPGLKKGAWADEEDQLLARLVSHAGESFSWVDISSQIKGRTTKQCRERWTLCLDPSINRKKWTAEEDSKLIALYESSGPQWCLMKEEFQNRTPNQLKSRFASLRKKDTLY